MQDTIIKGTGNSRSIKGPPNLLTLHPTWEAAAQAMIDGTFPIDLGPLNPAGVQTMGTDLNKATLLSDATAALYDLPSTAVPDEVLAKIAPELIGLRGRAKIEYGVYTGTGADDGARIVFSFQPKMFLAISHMTTSDYVGFSVKNNATSGSSGIIFYYDQETTNNKVNTSLTYVAYDSGGKRVVAKGGFNVANRTYSYLGIGLGEDAQ